MVPSEGATSGTASGVAVAKAPAFSVAPQSPHERTVMGKPLKWTRGMTVVVAIWVVVAVVLVLMRTQMGYLTDYTIEEQAALDAVPFALMSDGETTYREAMTAATERLGLASDLESTAQWYVWSRPWEGRVYVWLEYDHGDGTRLPLGWWVEDGEVTADPATERFLQSVLDGSAQVEFPQGWPEFLQDSLWSFVGRGRREAAPQGVLGDDARGDELQQVVGSSGL